TTFPESSANNQQARYMYYLGLIKAIQLDYTASHTHLLQAIRKAPQNYTTAGFQQTVYKLSIIVQLLMGEIPERALFRQPVLKKPLVPYLKLVQAVRIGDLSKFQEALAKYAEVFRKDKNYTLILRLRHNVIKTGIRMISLSYSRISLRDICFKLHLDSEEDAEYIVAKAIRDGVIDATLDHEKGFMKSKENADIYSTNEPQIAFHQRTSFCLNLHNESVKAMRFPLNAHPSFVYYLVNKSSYTDSCLESAVNTFGTSKDWSDYCKTVFNTSLVLGIISVIVVFLLSAYFVIVIRSYKLKKRAKEEKSYHTVVEPN
ncbi:270_t:CDS:10, partial [Entrophospora sp. SA101]